MLEIRNTNFYILRESMESLINSKKYVIWEYEGLDTDRHDLRYCGPSTLVGLPSIPNQLDQAILNFPIILIFFA